MSNLKCRSLIKAVAKADEEQIDKWGKSSLEYQTSDLLSYTLKINSESVSWLAALSRISMGDVGGFDYIAKKIDISLKPTNLYKGICSQ